MRMAKMPSMTSFNLNNKLNTKAIPPNTNKERCGKCNLGCNSLKKGKKDRSCAAA